MKHRSAATPVNIADLSRRLSLESDEEIVEMIEFFLQTVEPRLTELQQAISRQDIDQALHHAHAAKGAARNVGATELADILGHLEAILAEAGGKAAEIAASDALLQLAAIKQQLAGIIQRGNQT